MALIHKYIKTGTFDGTAGSLQTGDSESTAYQAGNAAEFDHIMRDLLNADGYHIHIAAGEYSTCGQRYSVTPPGGTVTAYGWDVRSDWTVSGAGENATVMRLYSWPSHVTPGTASSKWNVVGCPSDHPVSNVVIEYLTVDGNWTNLNNPPAGSPPGVALQCVAPFTIGPITCRHLNVIGFYGNRVTGTECFALSCHAIKQSGDPVEHHSAWLAVFDHCTVHHGYGDLSVGIASFNYGPSIIDGCHIYSLGKVSSSAIQVIGRDIQITNNIVHDCYLPFYVDTGNIINLLMEYNHFISNGPFVITTNSTLASVLIHIRQNDNEGSFDGVCMDVPIRPKSAEMSPQYRIRLYFHCTDKTTPAIVPLHPDIGILVPCPYGKGATATVLEGAIANGLDLYPWDAPGEPQRFVAFGMSNYGAVELSPNTLGTWKRESDGAPFTSDESKVYIQSGWSWTHWKIRKNYFEVPFFDPLGPPLPFAIPDEQWMICLSGNGSTDRDYQIADNVGRFTGAYAGRKMFALLMDGIERVTLLNNAFDYRSLDKAGEVQIYTAHKLEIIPIDVLDRFGNRDLGERPHPTLPNDIHQWGAQRATAGGGGISLTGTSLHFSTPTDITGSGTSFLDELRPGDMLATNTTGGLQTDVGTQAGPFYVQAVSQTSATLSRAVPANVVGHGFIAPVKRYRGPAAYLTEAGLPAFHVLNDGSVAIGGIPANLGFGEFYVNGNATISGPVLAGFGSAAVPAVSFASDTDTGVYRPAAGALGFAAGGGERVRVTSSALQPGPYSFGFGASAGAPDTFLVQDAASILALRNGSAAQTFRAYETWSSPGDYARLSLITQPGGSSSNYLIRSEAEGSKALRSLQLGSGEKSGLNSYGLDTILHAGQGAGSVEGGSILFQVQVTPGGGLETAWRIGTTGHLTANDAGKMIRWGSYSNFPAIKSSSTGMGLEIRSGDDSNGAALLHRMTVIASTAANYNIGENESGRCFTNAGATASVMFTLPSTAHVGFQCYFVVEAFIPFAMAIHPLESAATIRVGDLVTGPGYSLLSSASAATSAATLHLVCVASNRWLALRHIGTWFWT